MKMMQISDLHFGNHKDFLINPFLAEVSTFNPQLILISGDLTQRATHEQYQLSTAFFKTLPAKLLPVPGNHDIPLNNIFKRLLTPFSNYQYYIQPHLYSSFANEEVRILGVNSVNPYRIKNGRLCEKTMAQIHQFFAPEFSGLNLLFFHHNFDYLEGAHKPLENYQALIQSLKENNIHLVCAGHSHYANVSNIEKNNGHPCVFLHAGSLLCNRSKDGLNSYFQIEITQKICQIDWRVFRGDSFQTEARYKVDFSQQFSPL